MHKKIYSFLFTVISLISALSAWAQDSTENKKIEMADAMRSNGKIYVVVAVLVIILSGLFFYVVRLDRKINKMEKEFSNK
jgi:CcmD family protein